MFQPSSRESGISADARVALLRGINVGRAKRIAMAELRTLFVSLGYGDVRTLLNSGNVVFTTADERPARSIVRIEQALHDQLGLASRVTVLDATAIDTIIGENPLLDVATNHSRLMATVLTDPKGMSKLAPVLDADWAPEIVARGSRAVYLWMPDGVADSKASIALGKLVKDGATTRNWNTILKLRELMRAM